VAEVVAEEAHYQIESPTTMTTMMTAMKLAASHLTNYCVAAALPYLHCCHLGSTVLACRIPRICSSTDDYRRCTWCKPTMARFVPPDHQLIAAVAMLVAGLAKVVDSTVSLVTVDQYKCPGKTPHWSHLAVLKT